MAENGSKIYITFRLKNSTSVRSTMLYGTKC